MPDSIVVATQDDLAALWFHLIEDHGCVGQTHGDPFLMHGAAVAFGLCDRKYIYALEDE